MQKHRAWTRLPSGAHLDLINPSPMAWLDSDLSTRLARTSRWCGESTQAYSLSVAQHSLMVLALREQWSSKPLSPGDALNELLHDAEEGFLGFDCVSTLKPVFGAAFEDVSSNLLNAIRSRYQLPIWTPDAYRLHKIADVTCAATEAVHYVGWSRDEVKNVLGIEYAALDSDPLTYFGETSWAVWPPEYAENFFHKKFTSLLLQHKASILENF